MKPATRKLVNKVIATITLFCMTTQGTLAAYLDLANAPLFIGANVPPQVMLAISKEQQLFKKAYNDYSDLDEDGQLETTYKHDIDYYGYFDSYKCYAYNTGTQLFDPAIVKARNNATDDKGKPTPAAVTANNAAKYCAAGSGHWSGNFLNWISMSRMDTVRKLLYGGMRSTDTATDTILERVHLPADAHAWAKYYSGKVNIDPATGEVASIENDIDRLTPFSNIPVTTAPVAKTTAPLGDICTLYQQYINTVDPAFVLAPCGFPVVSSFFTGGAVNPTPTPTPDLATLQSLTAPGSAASIPFQIPNLAANATIDVDVGFTTSIRNAMSEGDQIRFENRANPGQFFIGVVLRFWLSDTVRVRVHQAGIAPGAAGAAVLDMNVTNLSRTGITFCNVTFPRNGTLFSQSNQDPPVIRAAQGNYSLWNANEKYQCYWRAEDTKGSPKVNQMAVFGINSPGSNGNQAALSDIGASAENPSQTEHSLGVGVAAGEFVVRVKACVAGLFGTERCKQYPKGNYKPIGLLQEYGDVDLIQFGLMTGSYTKNISGGVLRKNVGTFTNEVNVATDGTFTQPATPPGSPRDATSDNTPQGIVNTLNYIRIYGYRYENGDYRSAAGDNCTFQLTNITEGNCTSWGNPMSEMYFESLRYFAGKSPNDDYRYTPNQGSKDHQLGLPQPSWRDPLKSANYCAPLSVLVFNASVSTNDDDLRLKDAESINATRNVTSLTDVVGKAEGIHNGEFFVGKIIGESGKVTSSSDPGFELCTPKNIPGLGDVSGICPEGPTVAGSYLLSGLAHHARTTRIRSDIDVPSNDGRSLKVTTYGIQLATNVPTLLIPVPDSTTGQKVVIQPIYRLKTASGALGGGALVDLKFIEQKTRLVDGRKVGTGKVYINWEDSEQGGDYDQDVWGTLSWEIDGKTIKVTTNAIAESTTQTQGFGYTISGTTQDGPHFHSGIEGFSYIDPRGVLGCTNCQVLGAGGQSGPTSVTYDLGSSTGQTLQDPMWYAAKYGGFVDGNGDRVPDKQAEWDSKLSNGRPGTDGIPDTYFLVTNPLGLVAALDRAFVAILSNASASSVATNSTSLQTGTTIYQARFNANDWSGQVLAFGVDDKGQIAKDPTWDAGQILNSQSPLDDTSPPGKADISLNPDVIKSSGRTIITVNDNRVGVKFRWPNDPASPVADEIGPALVAALNLETEGASPAPDGRGKERLNWLRGSQANEGAAVTGLRVRPISRLGDIVNSNPNFIATPNGGFGDDKYTTFRTDNINREAMIYVGGNDGMLHGFRASDGREVLAYIPSMVHKKLGKLTDKKYVGSEHRYYVDGSPEIGDAFIKVGTETAESWRTVLVSSLGGGGQGLFALDVSKPRDFSETNASKIALWEFSDKDDPDLGYIFAQPTIRRMANGRFAAIVPGGYNHSKPEAGETACTDSSKPVVADRGPAGCSTNTTGSAYLFIIFLDGPGNDGVWDEGTDYVKIRAAAAGDSPTTPNGLTQPLAADVDADGFMDFVYAGDLRGNLWKFDVRLPANTDPKKPPVPSDASVAEWNLEKNRLVLFVAKTRDETQTQAITGKPEATLHPTSGFIITFGTGKYLERNDPYPPSGPPPDDSGPYQTQSFYGIWDKNDARPINEPTKEQTLVTSRTQLLEHKIDQSVESAAIRVVVPLDGQPNEPVWSTDTTPPIANDAPSEGRHMGWVLDLPGTGERSVFRPILTAGRLIFTTLLPLTQTCQFGGTSFTMVIDPTTGGRIDAAVLDTDANSQLNKDDVVSYGAQNDIFASGLQSTIGITPTPTIIRASGLPSDATNAAAKAGSQILGTSGPLVAASGVLLAYALAAGSSGGNASTVIGLSAAGGRVSWRELTAD